LASPFQASPQRNYNFQETCFQEFSLMVTKCTK